MQVCVACDAAVSLRRRRVRRMSMNRNKLIVVLLCGVGGALLAVRWASLEKRFEPPRPTVANPQRPAEPVVAPPVAPEPGTAPARRPFAPIPSPRAAASPKPAPVPTPAAVAGIAPPASPEPAASSKQCPAAPAAPAIDPPLAREALSFVGADPQAEAVWADAINDPSRSAHERQDLIEDLNEEGF